MTAQAAAEAEAASLPSAAALDAAVRRIAGVAAHTPLVFSPPLSQLAGCDVHLKLELRQPTRSFKVRGAANAVAARGGSAALVTASAGNHGAGVAYAARVHGRTAIVFVPAAAPAVKRGRIAALGARLRLVDGSYDDAEAAARDFADAQRLPFIHPFEDEDVVAGQGTVALEIVDELPAVRAVVLPIGGGGLAAGAGAALMARAPEAVVVGVQSRATRAMHAAFEAARPVAVPEEATLADGLAGCVSEASYRRARAVLEQVTLVEEAGIARAMKFLVERCGVSAEGSAAVGVAAVLSATVRLRGPAVIVITGGNVQAETLASVLAAG